MVKKIQKKKKTFHYTLVILIFPNDGCSLSTSSPKSKAKMMNRSCVFFFFFFSLHLYEEEAAATCFKGKNRKSHW